VLIQEKGTTTPFNIAGMATIPYAATESGMNRTRDVIQAYIRNGLANPNGSDSLVYEALPQLRVQRAQQQVSQFTVTHYRLKNCPEAGIGRRRVGFVTGDRRDIDVGQIWVNSENTNMQMDSFYGKSTSATIRYLGAEKDGIGMVVRDTIGDELRSQLNGRLMVDPATVIHTKAGALEKTNNVRWIFHVAAVIGQPLVGYRPIEQVEQCVKAALRLANRPEFMSDEIRSILFPIFGTGPGGSDVESTIRVCLEAAVEYLERSQNRPRGLCDIYFYVWGVGDLEVCNAVATKNPALLRDDSPIV
jgi:O-acetyl-ADP-ribose deacetylase (regulator of RNase III)